MHSESLVSWVMRFLFIMQDDMQRRAIWEENKRMIEDNNQAANL